MARPSEMQQFLSTLTARRADLERRVGSGLSFDAGDMLHEITELTEQLLVADEELRVQHEELERTRHILDRMSAEHDELFLSARDALVHTDLHGIIVNSNPAARRLFGDKEYEITAIRPMPTKFALGDRSVIRSLVVQAGTAEESRSGEAAVRRRGAPDVPCHVTVRRVADPAGDNELLLWTVNPRGHAAQPDVDPARPVRSVAELTKQLVGMPADEITATIVDLVRLAVPAAEQASITLSRRTRDGAITGFETAAASDDRVRTLDAVEYRTGGPCVDALTEQQIVAAEDACADARWPDFSPQAARLGFRSILACPMPGPANRLAALNLYASRPQAFSAAETASAAAFAFHAGTALAAADREANLRTAIETREIIGQAMGILMERHRLTPVQAFDMLVHVSQNRHQKLREVGRHLTETGEI